MMLISSWANVVLQTCRVTWSSPAGRSTVVSRTSSRVKRTVKCAHYYGPVATHLPQLHLSVATHLPQLHLSVATHLPQLHLSQHLPPQHTLACFPPTPLPLRGTCPKPTVSTPSVQTAPHALCVRRLWCHDCLLVAHRRGELG